MRSTSKKGILLWEIYVRYIIYVKVRVVSGGKSKKKKKLKKPVILENFI